MHVHVWARSIRCRKWYFYLYKVVIHCMTLSLIPFKIEQLQYCVVGTNYNAIKIMRNDFRSNTIQTDNKETKLERNELHNHKQIGEWINMYTYVYTNHTRLASTYEKMTMQWTHWFNRYISWVLVKRNHFQLNEWKEKK